MKKISLFSEARLICFNEAYRPPEQSEQKPESSPEEKIKQDRRQKIKERLGERLKELIRKTTSAEDKDYLEKFLTQYNALDIKDGLRALPTLKAALDVLKEHEHPTAVSRLSSRDKEMELFLEASQKSGAWIESQNGEEGYIYFFSGLDEVLWKFDTSSAEKQPIRADTTMSRILTEDRSQPPTITLPRRREPHQEG